MAEAPVDLGGDEASLWRSRGAGTRRTASSVRELVGGWWSGWMIEEGLGGASWFGGILDRGRSRTTGETRGVAALGGGLDGTTS